MLIELTVENGLPVEVRHFGDRKFAVKGYVWAEDGVTKACPVDKCNAYCCRTGSLYPDESPPCRFLSARNTCSIHEAGGQGAKPYGCVIYPRSQADIDAMNKDAKEGEGCLLRIEEL